MKLTQIILRKKIFEARYRNKNDFVSTLTLFLLQFSFLSLIFLNLEKNHIGS